MSTTTTSLNDFDAKLDALADTAKAVLSELEVKIAEARKAGSHYRHAKLHRLHRVLHDYVIVAAEPFVGYGGK